MYKILNMKNYLLMICMLITCHLSAQSTNSKLTFRDKAQVYAEVSGLQAIYNLVSVGAGLEINRYQFGINFLAGNHLFSHAFNEVTFVNYGDLHFVHNRSEDIIFKAYLNKSRKGAYAGMLLNFLHWDVNDHVTKLVQPIATTYVVPYIGYRLFPFKEYFYIDASVGLAYNFRAGQSETIGTKTYSFNKTGLEFSPNFSIGKRFSLRKKKS
jgi:hypothetical protein